MARGRATPLAATTSPLQQPLDEAAIAAAMAWADPERDVALPRQIAARLLASGGRLFCVWSGRRLDAAWLDIDHCLPWSAWPCSDLWNLLPADRSVNQHQKRDRLAASMTVTLRSSCRLRPRWRLLVTESGVALAQRSLACWCRVGWLSLSCMIRSHPAVLAASNVRFGNAAHRA